MAPVLLCPECGEKHPLDDAGGSAFPCKGCGRMHGGILRPACGAARRMSAVAYRTLSGRYPVYQPQPTDAPWRTF